MPWHNVHTLLSLVACHVPNIITACCLQTFAQVVQQRLKHALQPIHETNLILIAAHRGLQLQLKQQLLSLCMTPEFPIFKNQVSG